jgi:hypothetical protein
LARKYEGGRRMNVGTGKFDKNGKEMMVGDIVHFRCENNALCGKGVVYFAEKPDRLGEDLFRIRDTTPGKREGRIYPYYEDATYRIDERKEEHDVVSESE